MKSSQFPVTYFANCFSAKKMFLNRRELKIWQMLIVIIFLIFMLLNPVAINANNSPEFKLDNIMPDLTKQVSESKFEEIKQITFTNNKLTEQESQKLSNEIYLNTSKKDFEKVKTGLNFENDKLVMKDENGLSFELRYTDDWNFESFSSVKDFENWLNKEWNAQNAPYRILSMTILVAVLVLSSTLFLVFGTAFFIWLTKRNHISSIKSYKESLNVTLNSLFLSTLIATIIGLIHYDITLMMTIQAFGLAIQVLIIFAKTKFNDNLAEGKPFK